ncbi:MAG: translation elongation factor Ts [Gammaproteobacteria bacterium]|nr:translation elongation factor Ts [Gammaproteobacteria bacterium]MXW44424.1 elongation factor Ts [Gammaproteobacteria bacterium]MYD02587.1 elongation factor Ts [Gammaproteobacteria bacterium]MYI26185.1 elongation factor Ts [Gammaproteobacteria bacterium]
MAITAAEVKALRESTGAGMMDCKRALTETKGDAEAARNLLRKQGAAAAEKKASRAAAEGVIAVAESSGAIAVAEVNCETDFVARREDFRKYAASVAQTAVEQAPASLEDLLALEVDGQSLEQSRQDAVARIGENISVRRFERIQAQGEASVYVHNNRIGVVVDLEGGDAELGKNIAMHVAAMRPQHVSPDDVPADIVERERTFLSDQAAESGKPPEIVARMVEGRLRKFLDGICLTGQIYVRDSKLTVGKLLASQKARVRGFVRLEVGEGIERPTSDLAEEVEAQLREHR